MGDYCMLYKIACIVLETKISMCEVRLTKMKEIWLQVGTFQFLISRNLTQLISRNGA